MKQLVALGLLLGTLPVFGDGKALEAALKTTYRDKVVTLRNFYSASDLRYDQDGQLVGSSESGPWTVTGPIEITEVSLKPSELFIAGKRLLAVYEDKGNRFTYIRTPDKVALRIAVSSDPTETQIQKAMATVLVSAGELSRLVPPVWKSFLEKGECHRQSAATAEIRKSNEITLGVIQGTAISQPKPAYPPLARQARVQGSVRLAGIISRQGTVTDICIAKPMGAGLDEAAIAAVEQWRYHPYLLKGEPVEVETQITVNFELN